MGEGGRAAVDPHSHAVRATAVGCAAAAVVSALVAAFWYSHGLYALAADESARVLEAAGWSRHPLSLGSAVWLPLHRVVVGTALRVDGDLFVTPRVVTVLLGCLAVALVGWLAFELFARPVVSVLAAFLVALSPDRVILGTVPLAEALFLVSFITTVGFVARFLRLGRPRDAWFAALAAGLTSATRYEGWVIAAAAAAALVAGVATGRVRLPWTTVAGIAALLALVPVGWMVYSEVRDGSFTLYADEYRRWVTYESSLLVRLRESVLGEMFGGYVVLGAAGLAASAVAASRSVLVRRWLVVPVASLFLLTALQMVGGYTGTWAPWRTSTAWAVVLAPCLAWAIVGVGERLRLPGAVAGAVAVVALGAWSYVAVDATPSRTTAGDRRAGAAIARLLHAADGRAVAIAEGDDYGDLMLEASATSLVPTHFEPCRVDHHPVGISIERRCLDVDPAPDETRIVAVRDRATASALERRLGRAPVRRVGAWSIFVMGPV